MTKEQKINLLKFLYLNDQTQTFLCNDLFQEFMSIIPKTNCISEDNFDTDIRRNNYDDAINSIHNFLIDNKDYKVMVALTENKDIDIFKDKNSICYTEGPSILDIIC